MKKTLSILILFLALAGCAGRSATFLKPAEAVPGPAPAEDARARALRLWNERIHPDSARAMVGAFLKAAEAESTDRAFVARASRAVYFVAQYIETDPALKDSLYTLGLRTAERALGLHPAFRKVFEETNDEKRAVDLVGGEDIEAVYWYAANLGRWAAAKGLLVRLGNKAKLEKFNQRVKDLNDTFFYGAAYRFFGALPTKVPGGDMEESRRNFEKALEIAPHYFGTRVLYAELWATKMQDKATFVKQLETVVSTPYDVLPDVAPENKYEQEYARKLLERAGEFFD